jgi:hypothetical protein
MRGTRRSRISTLLIAAACGPSTGEPHAGDDSSTSVVATTESSGSSSESTSGESTSADTSSSGALDESTGAALECPGGGQSQLSASHWIDLSAWPSDEGGTSWEVDTDCTFVEFSSTDALNYHFACVHPDQPQVELVLVMGCFSTDCDLKTLTPGESVQLETHVSITGPRRNPVSEIWTVLRDEDGELLFIGMGARTVEFPGGPEGTAPLSFELAPPGSCEPTFECSDHEPAPLVVSSGRESAVVHDSSVSTIELGGESYDISVETSCRGLGGDDDSYTASFLLFPSPDLVR